MDESGEVLLFGQILWSLRGILDLSMFLPDQDSKSKKLFFSEILEKVAHGLSEEAVRHEMSRLRQMPGSFKVEYPYQLNYYFAIPLRAIYVREKAYLYEILRQETIDAPRSTGARQYLMRYR